MGGEEEVTVPGPWVLANTQVSRSHRGTNTRPHATMVWDRLKQPRPSTLPLQGTLLLLLLLLTAALLQDRKQRDGREQEGQLGK